MAGVLSRILRTIFHSKRPPPSEGGEREKRLLLGSCPSAHLGHQSPVSTSQQLGGRGRALGASALCVGSWALQTPPQIQVKQTLLIVMEERIRL